MADRTKGDDTAAQVAKLTSDLNRRRHDAQAAQRRADEQVHKLRRELDTALKKLDERITTVQRALDARARDLDARRDQDRTAFREELRQELRRLERYVRAVPGARTADLTPDAEIIELARRAEAGRVRRAEMLDEEERGVAVDAVAAWADLQEELKRTTRAAIASSRAVASTRPGTVERRAVQRDYLAARRSLDDLRSRQGQVQQKAVDAARTVKRDESLQRDNGPAVADGDQAWAQLIARLRALLTSAVDAGELPPPWFTEVLGLGPPPQAERWFDSGAHVLAYRATYDIADTTTALGPEPGPDWPDHRTSWLRSLRELLRPAP